MIPRPGRAIFIDFSALRSTYLGVNRSSESSHQENHVPNLLKNRTLQGLILTVFYGSAGPAWWHKLIPTRI